MTEPIYTMPQLKDAWDDYRTAMCWVVTKAGGNKSVRMTAPDPNVEKLIACNMRKVKDSIGFPKYLEIVSG
jgi:hypothetical protein